MKSVTRWFYYIDIELGCCAISEDNNKITFLIVGYQHEIDEN
jgi:hypothetical protein